MAGRTRLQLALSLKPELLNTIILQLYWNLDKTNTNQPGQLRVNGPLESLEIVHISIADSGSWYMHLYSWQILAHGICTCTHGRFWLMVYVLVLMADSDSWYMYLYSWQILAHGICTCTHGRFWLVVYVLVLMADSDSWYMYLYSWQILTHGICTCTHGRFWLMVYVLVLMADSDSWYMYLYSWQILAHGICTCTHGRFWLMVYVFVLNSSSPGYTIKTHHLIKEHDNLVLSTGLIINNYWMRLSMISWIIKTKVCVICRSRRLRQITQTRGFDNSWYHAKTEFKNCFIIHLHI